MCTILHHLVYEAVKQIPRGKVTTYGAIAKALGDRVAARTVARILSENKDPEGVPCYKVVMSDGSLGGYAFGGPEEKARRLREEGIEVRNGKVNLRRYLFEEFDIPPILEKMKRAQILLAEMNKRRSFDFEYIVGVDVAYRGCKGVGVAVMADKGGNIVGTNRWTGKVDFPYVPTYLGFREAKFMVKAIEPFLKEPILLFVDGQGTAHPRKAGEAVHVGAILDVPSIGIAKSPLLRGQKPRGRAYVSPGWMLPDTSLVDRFWFRGKKQPLVLEVADRLSKRLKLEIP